MKKILLATATIGVFTGMQSYAAGPTVTLGGYADFQVGVASQEGPFDAAGADSRDVHTRTDTELHISVDGKADNGLGYGAYIELDADVSDDDSTTSAFNDDANAERTYIYIDSAFGRVELGANSDAGDSLRVDAASFARGSGGISGDWFRYVNLTGDETGATQTDAFYILPGLPTAVMPEQVANGTYEERATANKVSIYTPRIQGLQAGVSFTPDQGERGTSSGFSGQYDVATGINAPDFENVWNLGVNYSNEFNGVGIKGSVTGEFGDAEDETAATPATKDDLSAYAAGLNISYAGVTVGGSYAILKELGRDIVDNSEGQYWTAGAGYEYGAFGVSVGYLNSEIENEGTVGQDSELSNLSFGADYKLAPGLVPYVEVSVFETDNNDGNTSDNEGSVVIVGTELNF